jgi:AcrR family transcriptional regulator
MTRVSHLSKNATRQHILSAALRSFAESGYAGTSVQQIVNAAKVSKPALYYYFRDKADLFAALVDYAHDERYRLLREAAETGRGVEEKLVAVTRAIFDFALRHKELMRLSFATAFGASGENPVRCQCLEKGRRNFEFLKQLIEEGQSRGELDRCFSAEDLAVGIYGQATIYVLLSLVSLDVKLNQASARTVVDLFMEGAGPKRSGSGRRDRRKSNKASV